MVFFLLGCYISTFVEVIALLALTCGCALDVAVGGVGLDGLRGAQQRPVVLAQPFLLPSDCATPPGQSSSSHATPGALHATCAHSLGTSCPYLTVVCMLGQYRQQGAERGGAQTSQFVDYTILLT